MSSSIYFLYKAIELAKICILVSVTLFLVVVAAYIATHEEGKAHLQKIATLVQALGATLAARADLWARLIYQAATQPICEAAILFLIGCFAVFLSLLSMAFVKNAHSLNNDNNNNNESRKRPYCEILRHSMRETARYGPAFFINRVICYSFWVLLKAVPHLLVAATMCYTSGCSVLDLPKEVVSRIIGINFVTTFVTNEIGAFYRQKWKIYCIYGFTLATMYRLLLWPMPSFCPDAPRFDNPDIVFVSDGSENMSQADVNNIQELL